MGKNLDKLGSIDTFKAPWETDSGETEIVKDRLKRFIYNVFVDKAKAEDAALDQAELVSAAEQKVKDVQDELAKADSTGAVSDLQSKLAKAESARDTAQSKLDRLEVGIEKGLTPKQAARLQGSTVEELKADADEILETFGVAPTTQETDEEREAREEAEAEEAAATGRTVPKVRTNPGDPKNGSDAEPDYDKIAAGIVNRTITI